QAAPDARFRLDAPRAGSDRLRVFAAVARFKHAGTEPDRAGLVPRPRSTIGGVCQHFSGALDGDLQQAEFVRGRHIAFVLAWGDHDAARPGMQRLGVDLRSVIEVWYADSLFLSPCLPARPLSFKPETATPLNKSAAQADGSDLDGAVWRQPCRDR